MQLPGRNELLAAGSLMTMSVSESITKPCLVNASVNVSKYNARHLPSEIRSPSLFPSNRIISTRCLMNSLTTLSPVFNKVIISFNLA